MASEPCGVLLNTTYGVSNLNRIAISISLTMVLIIWSAWNIMWGGEHAQGIVKADGKGYYAHLPAVLIYHDLNFGFFDSIDNGKYYNANYAYDYRKFDHDGRVYNKYYAGTAVAMLPFFVGGHLYATYSGYDPDGYSIPYKISISIAAICYLLLTLLVWVRILKMTGISASVISLTIPIMVFGTNWYYYVVCEPAMSHVYTVFFASWFILLGLKWAKTKRINLPLIGFLVGLMVWIRPVNGLILAALPFCFPTFKDFTKAIGNLFKQPGRLLLSIGISVGIVSLQLVLYKLQTGHFLIYSYEQEGFNFRDPQIANILFSYKKGLFLYTPIMLLGALGLVLLASRSAWKSFTSILFVAVFTYVVSSWWNWYYGGSFSSRVYLDILVFFAIGIATLLDKIRSKTWKAVTTSVLVVLVLFCQFQTYQYRRNVIHWDNMNAEKYWDVFLDFSVFSS